MSPEPTYLAEPYEPRFVYMREDAHGRAYWACLAVNLPGWTEDGGPGRVYVYTPEQRLDPAVCVPPGGRWVCANCSHGDPTDPRHVCRG